MPPGGRATAGAFSFCYRFAEAIYSADLTVQQALHSNHKKRDIIILTLILFIGMLLLGLCIILYVRKRKKKNLQLHTEGNLAHNSKQSYTNQIEKEDLELPLFDFATIANSTNQFSIDNKLGEGGFGPAFKYESRKTLLDWPKRFHIIIGIARGLLYLHQDSRLRIIHRDLKASNILLDIEMNPKISDFGMARIFGGNEIEGNTEKVVGTYGYMSLEYVVNGLFSVKSDVFSFGVLVLEIVSGKRNRGFFHPDHHLNLLGHAWRLDKEDRSMELIDEAARDKCCLSKALRSIHVGLLCVQQHPKDRPTMSSVVLMLGSEDALPLPKQPGFFTERNLPEAVSSSNKTAPKNSISICYEEKPENTDGIDTIGANQTIRDGETLVSAGGSFELEFFSPGSGRSRNRYLGIWYKDTATGTVVWVANRDFPLNDTSDLLKQTDQGILVLLNPTEGVVWSSNSSRFTSSPLAQLLESGNLVVNDGNGNNTESFLWQSFDYPSDTLLPGMKFGMNMMTGLDWYLSSWKSGDDPARGDFTYGLDPSGYPQFIIKNGAVDKMRFGPWNGLRFSGVPNLKQNSIFTFEFVFNQVEIYYRYEQINSSVVTRLVLNPNGVIQRFVWINRTHGWIAYTTPQTDNCDFYELCGALGSCNIDTSTMCQCLQGFAPKYPGEWSNGCVHRTQLGCGVSDGFLQYSNVKLPDMRYCWFNESMTLDECRVGCLKNCSCTAYANMDIRGGGSGCFLWFGDLIDIRTYSTNGPDVYVKVAASELGRIGTKKLRRRTIAIILALLAGVFLTGLSLTVYLWKKKQQQQHQISEVSMRRSFNEGCTNESQKQDLELQQFDFATITHATDNFSINNKLGEGSFGPVFKGVLEDGQEIAVKTLSKNSKQGVDEFKNEVIYIAILQHRNLVKLLGYCFRGEEKMLIYEYMPNKSLDLFIFDITQRLLLDRPKRLNIINGIARRLLYLHQDSRLRIIHRDLKASNILLDNEMNPKISDFGMARHFGGNESEANTSRVVGTYFGVLVLEIVSGKRNIGFSHPGHHLNLLGHAWKLCIEGRSRELVDPLVEDLENQSELVRAIHVGLLCVQQYPEDRPNMSTVVLMLGGEGGLPLPKQPGFFTKRNVLPEKGFSTSTREPGSDNIVSVTVTLLEGR
ncbi:unnamed protein product [Camellia sinensis]